MKSIDRIDEQPTAVDQPSLRLRHVFQDRRSGKDRRMGVTHMDPALDRRKGERRINNRRGKERRMEATDRNPKQDRRNGERRMRLAWLF
jgi:thymidine kinase